MARCRATTGLSLVAALAFGSFSETAFAESKRCELAPREMFGQEGKRGISAEDLVNLTDFGDPGVSPSSYAFELQPGGAFLAVRARRAIVGDDSYCTAIALVPLDSKNRTKVIDDGGDIAPATGDIYGITDIPVGGPKAALLRWSPSGGSLAYTKIAGTRSEIWIYELASASSHLLLSSAVDIEALSWSPDGTAVLFSSRPGKIEALASIEAEGRQGYHYDGRFWPLSGDRPFVSSDIPSIDQAIDVQNSAGRAVRPDDVSALHPSASRPAGSIRFAESNDGSRLAWTTRESDSVSGETALKVKVEKHDIACGWDVCSNIVAMWWSDDGNHLLYQRYTGIGDNRTEFFMWSPGNGKPRRFLSTIDAVFGCRPWQQQLVCAQETSTKPRRIIAVSPSDGRRRTLFDPNPWFDKLSSGSVRRLEWSNEFNISTFGDLVLPPSPRERKRLPLVIVQYDSRGFLRGGTGDEYPIQAMAAQGFAVLSFNRPMWYGSLHKPKDQIELLKASINGWADRRSNLSSLKVIIDKLVNEGLVDANRVAITGLSDGASTATFALSNSTLFSAAILSTCCEAPSTLALAGEALHDFYVEIGYPTSFAANPGFWREGSLMDAPRARPVPMLIQASSGEYRMALTTYRELKGRGWPIEMFVYPDEGHVKVHPAHRLAIYRRNIAWLQKQLSP